MLPLETVCACDQVFRFDGIDPQLCERTADPCDWQRHPAQHGAAHALQVAADAAHFLAKDVDLLGGFLEAVGKRVAQLERREQAANANGGSH